MNRQPKKRRKALARQARENRNIIRHLLAASETKVLHRFTHVNGMVTGRDVHYSDEESE